MHSKGLTFYNALFVCITLGAGAVFSACGVDYSFGGYLDPYADCFDQTWSAYDSIGCKERRCSRDAGAPGDNCGDAGASSSGPGARCSGTCVPNKPDGFDPPQAVYVGPSKPWPHSDDCPANVGSLGDLRYTDLKVPSAGCPACLCGPIDGSCAPTPDVVLNADLCNTPLVSTTDFNGPTDWDGSCTTTNAVPANLECPPGSGVLCAQSIVTSSLPAPVEGCKPIPLPVPKATTDKPWWDHVVLSCSSTVRAEGCEEFASHQCYPSLPKEDGWRYCVRRTKVGVFDCPAASEYTDQVLAYLYDAYIDTRSCTECTCETSGGKCFGTLRAYNDDTCSTNESVALMLSSDWPNCSNIALQGDALSSKEITDLQYVPGSCVPNGGEPIGDVEFITTVSKQMPEPVVTWCCMAK